MSAGFTSTSLLGSTFPTHFAVPIWFVQVSVVQCTSTEVLPL